MHKGLIKTWLIALGCLIIVSSAACSTAADKAPAAIINTKTSQAQVGKIESNIVTHLTADGRLSVTEDRRLTFRTSGTVEQISVKELEKVTKGQVLAKLDTTSLEQAVTAAELGVKTIEIAQKLAQMDVTQAESAVKAAEVDLKQVQENITAAGIDLDQAQDNFRKIAYPYSYVTVVFDVPEAMGAVNDAKLQINDAIAGLQVGLSDEKHAAALDSLQKALDSLTKSQDLLNRGQGDDVFQNQQLTIDKYWTLRAAQLTVDKAKLAVENANNTASKVTLAADIAKATLVKAQLALEKIGNDMAIANNGIDIAKTNLDYAVIKSPIDGVVAKVNVKAGDYISPLTYATTLAVEIIDPGQMELNVQVNQLDISRVALDQKVTIEVDSLPGQVFSGAVTSIELVPISATGVVSYEVKTVFDDPQSSALKTGMTASVDFGIDQ